TRVPEYDADAASNASARPRIPGGRDRRQALSRRGARYRAGDAECARRRGIRCEQSGMVGAALPSAVPSSHRHVHHGALRMKITTVYGHPLSVPYAQPRWTAHERMERDQMVLVEVHTDAGLTGYGEIAGGPQPVICDLLARFAEVVVGMDPLGHVEIWQK